MNLRILTMMATQSIAKVAFDAFKSLQVEGDDLYRIFYPYEQGGTTGTRCSAVRGHMARELMESEKYKGFDLDDSKEGDTEATVYAPDGTGFRVTNDHRRAWLELVAIEYDEINRLRYIKHGKISVDLNYAILRSQIAGDGNDVKLLKQLNKHEKTKAKRRKKKAKRKAKKNEQPGA